MESDHNFLRFFSNPSLIDLPFSSKSSKLNFSETVRARGGLFQNFQLNQLQDSSKGRVQNKTIESVTYSALGRGATGH